MKRIQVAYNMDCMDLMRLLPDKEFDLAIVDPPYGGGQAWGGWFRSQYGVRGRAEHGAENISGKNTVQPRMGGRFQKYQEISAEATPLNVKKKYSETAHKLAIFATGILRRRPNTLRNCSG